MRLHGLTTPDPRPYAAPTDLVTAADVAEWLNEQALSAPAEPIPVFSLHWVLATTRTKLLARLDRERRQACRRGALACWRAFAGEARENRHPRYRDAYTALVWGDKPTDLYRIGEIARANLTRALAFRAAARAR